MEENKLDAQLKFNISLCSKNGATLSFTKIAANVLSLQRGLTGNRALAGGGYMQDQHALQAYLLYYWPVSFLQTNFILKNSREVLEKIRNTRGAAFSVLDLGSGPAPASSALLDYIEFSLKQKCSFNVELFDSSERALALAKKILSRNFSKRAQVNATVCNFEKSLPPISKKFDFIIASHSLNELWPGEKNRSERLFNLAEYFSRQLSDDGLFIITEPALLQTSRALIALRDALIKNGLSVVAPCLCSCAPCPALENPNATCHTQFTTALPAIVKDLANRAKLNREEIKMTYFIFKKTPSENQSNDGEVPAQNAFTARVVSDPMLNKAGRTRFVLCDGKARFTLSAKEGEAGRAEKAFFGLKRDDTIFVQDAARRSKDTEPLSLGVTEETKIERV